MDYAGRDDLFEGMAIEEYVLKLTNREVKLAFFNMIEGMRLSKQQGA